VGPPGRTTERDGDRIIAHDPDGSTTVYDRDDQGRERVHVDDGFGARTYVYEEGADGTRITEYDENGDVVGHYLYNAQGNSASNGITDRGNDPAPKPPSHPSGPPGWLWLLGGLLLAMATAVAAVIWRRRRPNQADPDWAHGVAARLDDEGRQRGRGRNRGETVVDHAHALIDGPLPDARLREVGEIVSAALFGRHLPDEAIRNWVDQVVREATDANPPPRFGRRKVDAPA
jgi:hypothetical protein